MLLLLLDMVVLVVVVAAGIGIWNIDWNLRMLNTFYAERLRHTLLHGEVKKVRCGLEFMIHNLSINRVAV